ncbi:hypothetical protein JOD43_003779 [Pullulanibacillus pueri]|nr:hypothetical protein [Pullulanibacillus pueri]
MIGFVESVCILPEGLFAPNKVKTSFQMVIFIIRTRSGKI